jgi:hypothetical protein
VHEALLDLAVGADDRAPGGAVTRELCGHWEHEGACRWPHHTAVESHSGQGITVRTVFLSDAGEEDDVRRRIVRAVRAGGLEGPTGITHWTVVAEGPASLRPSEVPVAQRLGPTSTS